MEDDSEAQRAQVLPVKFAYATAFPFISVESVVFAARHLEELMSKWANGESQVSTKKKQNKTKHIQILYFFLCLVYPRKKKIPLISAKVSFCSNEFRLLFTVTGSYPRDAFVEFLAFFFANPAQQYLAPGIHADVL